MSTYYNIRTKATIQDVSQSKGITIEDKEGSGHCYLIDNYNNGLSCMHDDEGRIFRVTRYGGNDVTPILYTLVVDYESLILDEYSDLELIHDAILNAKTPVTKYYIKYGTSYEEFTISMLNYLKDDEHWYRYDLKKAEHRLKQIEKDLLTLNNNKAEDSINHKRS